MQPATAPSLQPRLEAMLGPGAAFRDGQREAIEAIVRDGARALVVQRTGWSKSLVYWIATRVRRDEGHGPTRRRPVAPTVKARSGRNALPERQANCPMSIQGTPFGPR